MKLCLLCKKHTEESFFNSMRGMNRKHKQEVMSFPVTCEVCDYKMEDKMDMNKLMIKHSYKTIDYQCEECAYCGVNEVQSTWEIVKVKKQNSKFLFIF